MPQNGRKCGVLCSLAILSRAWAVASKAIQHFFRRIQQSFSPWMLSGSSLASVDPGQLRSTSRTYSESTAETVFPWALQYARNASPTAFGTFVASCTRFSFIHAFCAFLVLSAHSDRGLAFCPLAIAITPFFNDSIMIVPHYFLDFCTRSKKFFRKSKKPLT